MSGCTNPISAKNVYLGIVIEDYLPDVIGVNELGPDALYAENILVNVLKPINPNYERAVLTNDATSDETNMLFYDASKLGLKSQSVIPHNLRDINVYTLYYKDANLATSQDTIFMHFINIHLKAGSTTQDQNTRLDQANQVMAYMTNAGDPGNYFLMGDFNVQTSTEASYQKFVADPNPDIRFVDPINTPGSWNSNSSFANVHTQSTRTTALADCGSSGGMDDRFDFILVSGYVMNGTDRVSYIPGTYMGYGQDGIRYNQTINSPTNTAVSVNVAGALYSLSDHLPVVLQIEVEGDLVSINPEKVFVDVPLQIGLTHNGTAEEKYLWIYRKNEASSNVAFVRLYDAQGKKVKESKIALIDKEDFVSLNDWFSTKGIYFIEVEVENGYKAFIKAIH